MSADWGIPGKILLGIGTFVKCVSWIMAGFVVLCLVLFFALMDRPLSDEDLIENYNQHKAEFNQLAVLLMDQDEYFIVHPGGNRCSQAGKSMAAGDNRQCAELIRYFKLLNLEWSYAGRAPLWLYTPVAGGWELRKGYFYNPEKFQLPVPGQIVSSTNVPCDGLCFRKIDTDWYIFISD